MMSDDVPPDSRKRKRQSSWCERREDFLDGTPSSFDPHAPVKKTKVISAADFNASNPPAIYTREHAGPIGTRPKPVSAFSTDKSEREPYCPAQRGRFGIGHASSGGQSSQRRRRFLSRDRQVGDDPVDESTSTSGNRCGGSAPWRYSEGGSEDAGESLARNQALDEASARTRSRYGRASGESIDPARPAFDQNAMRNSSGSGAESLLEGRRPKRKARDKVMDILARRPHSRLEIEQKMSPHYSMQEIVGAIQFAEENGWMMQPEEMAFRLSLELGRRKKGHRFIAQYLKKRGLPQVETDRDAEVEKAMEFIASKAEQFGRASERSTARSLTKAATKAERLAAKTSAKSAAQSFGNKSGNKSASKSRSAASLEFDAKRAVYLERSRTIQKMQASLASRGFDGDTINRALRIWQDEQKAQSSED